MNELAISNLHFDHFKTFFLLKVSATDCKFFNADTGASLERVPRVPRHPLRFGNGCLAPVLIIDLGIEHPKIRLRRPDFEVKEKILLPKRLEK